MNSAEFGTLLLWTKREAVNWLNHRNPLALYFWVSVLLWEFFVFSRPRLRAALVRLVKIWIIYYYLFFWRWPKFEAKYFRPLGDRAEDRGNLCPQTDHSTKPSELQHTRTDDLESGEEKLLVEMHTGRNGCNESVGRLAIGERLIHNLKAFKSSEFKNSTGACVHRLACVNCRI